MTEGILLNLSLLITCCVISGFLRDLRWWSWKNHAWLQGGLFGGAAVLGMLFPVVTETGIIYDGRSVILSLSSWYFGWRCSLVAGAIAMLMRVQIAGPGLAGGLSVIVAASLCGLAFRMLSKPEQILPDLKTTLWLGLSTHFLMFALLQLLLPPGDKLMQHGQMMLILFTGYPLATLLAERVLANEYKLLFSLTHVENQAKRLSLLHVSNLQTTMEGYLLTDAAGNILEVNGRYVEMSGYSQEELLRMTAMDLDIPQKGEPSHGDILATLKAEKTLHLLRTHQTKHGEFLRVEINARLVESPDGLRICAFLKDITAQEEQQRHIRLRTAALEASSAPVVITDPNGRLLWANAAFAASIGLPPEALPDAGVEAFSASGIRPDAMGPQLWDTVRSGKVWSSELTTCGADGQRREEFLTITPLKNSEDEVTHLIGIKQDITELKNLERMLFRAQRLESVGSLASGIAHDLNNILSPILMSADILRNQLPEGESRDMAELIANSANRGAGVLRQLLAYARGAPGEKIELQLKPLLHETLKMFRETFPKDIRFEESIPGELPLIYADPNQVHQLFSNLLFNARDAMPDGGTLQVSVCRADLSADWAAQHPPATPGAFLRLSVTDDGCGMSEETAQRIFDPFFSTKQNGKNSGLGLATCMGVVRGHQGFILVHTAPQQGTRFEIYFPVLPSDKSAQGHSKAHEAAQPSAVPKGRGERILIVDDEASVRQMIESGLKALNYLPASAACGEDAIHLIEDSPGKFDLILLDYMMPGMNGGKVVACLKEKGLMLPVLLITGMMPDQETMHEAVQDLPVLRKPFSVVDLAEAIAAKLHALR